MIEASFERLAPFLREFIYTEAWEGLRPVQVESIQALMDTEDDLLIMAGTAGGKTEAAFLPILSLIQPDPIGSVRVVYVGPLRALINDQFQRMESLCEKGGIPVHRWHGDIDSSHKSQLIKNPGGILQITPESIESLLINKTDKLRRLFGGLRFIVVDEVHVFLESDRGAQLRSQLERLSNYAILGRPRRIGLSATVGDIEIAKCWLNPLAPERVKIINPLGVTVSTRLSHLHFALASADLPPELVDDLYELTRNHKSLIFCNSRSNVELVTSQLNRRCQHYGLNDRYLPHHGSISKEIREEAEARMKNSEYPVSVVCTNTLELGIDIGQLDLVVQIDSTHSVMSFIQRLGRSGRRPGEPRVMQMYTSEMDSGTNVPFYQRLPFGLLKALAVTDLFLEGWIEPPLQRAQPYNVLYHQLLSRLVETYGSTPRDLINFFLNTRVFPGVVPDDYSCLLQQLIAINHIEQMTNGDLILGLAGERIVRSREFYAVFQTPPEWDVRYNQRTVGRISPTPDLTPGTCLLLAGQVWEVKEILPKSKQVLVTPAKEARNMMFAGNGVPEMHPKIGQRVHEILGRSDMPQYLSQPGQTVLAEARRMSAEINLGERSIFESEKEWIIFPWTGTRAARTLKFALQREGLKVSFPVILFPWVMSVKRECDWKALQDKLRKLSNSDISAESIVADIPIELLRIHKYDEFLPESLLRSRAVGEWADWDEARQVLIRLASIGTVQ